MLLAAGPACALDPYQVYVSIDAEPDGDGSAELPFVSIQQGIDACAAGGTVYVLRGNYYESLYIDKPLYLCAGGIDAARLFQGQQASTIAGTSDVTISGLVLLGDPDLPQTFGTALHVIDSDRVTVLSCKLPYLEIGVLAQNSEVVVADSILEFSDYSLIADADSWIGMYSNVAVGNGAVVQCEDGALVEYLGNAGNENLVEVGAGCLEVGR